MLKIHQISCPVGKVFSKSVIAEKLRCRESDILEYTIDRESLDARHDPLTYIYTVFANVKNEEKYLRLKDVDLSQQERYELPKLSFDVGVRPIVVGFGPAGMYSALILAECGLKPIVLERGQTVEQRAKDVTRFFQEGILDSESNVQFGEGGAGTFSDGKLTTRIKNLRIQKVFEELIEAGASKEIMYQSRPHIGTDQLQGIVKKIREKIIRLGGEIHFGTCMQDVVCTGGKLTQIITSQGIYQCTHAIFALGHSASDTYRSLYQRNILIEPKDFAAGVRVEHPQELINRNQYGRFYNHPALGAASYTLTAKTSTGRGVYSFCMCPGGVVIPSSTAQETLAVNGMSYSNRGGRNANSAILVQIFKKDFFKGDVMDGFDFQHALEKGAYRNHYQAPAQNIKDFVNHQKTDSFVLKTSYPRGIISESMDILFQEDVNQAMREGFIYFDRKINGFLDQGMMIGMESRSSSPIRMTRLENGESVSHQGIYPCGEGAGYAGGIVSSAVDGIRQAENLMMNLMKEKGN